MRADARALHARLWERRERQAFRRGFDRSLLNAWAGAGYQSYFLRDRSGGHGVSQWAILKIPAYWIQGQKCKASPEMQGWREQLVCVSVRRP